MFAATLKGAQLPIEAFIWWPLPKMSLSWTIFPLNKFPVPDFGREKTHCAFFHWEFPGMNMAQNKSPMFFLVSETPTTLHRSHSYPDFDHPQTDEVEMRWQNLSNWSAEQSWWLPSIDVSAAAGGSGTNQKGHRAEKAPPCQLLWDNSFHCKTTS